MYIASEKSCLSEKPKTNEKHEQKKNYKKEEKKQLLKGNFDRRTFNCLFVKCTEKKICLAFFVGRGE